MKGDRFMQTAEMRCKLPVSALAERCDPRMFSFHTTKELTDRTQGMIGQERAVKAMEMGLDIQDENYHMFLTGASGLGKTTYARRKAKEAAEKRQVPADWIYTYSFEDPRRPRVMSIPAGMAEPFAKDIKELIEDLQEEIASTLRSKSFERKKVAMAEKHEKAINEHWEKLEEEATSKGFALEKTEEDIVAVPLKDDGEPHSDESYNELSKSRQDYIIEESQTITRQVNDFLRQQQVAKRILRRQLREADEQMVQASIQGFISTLKDEYINEGLHTFLSDMEKDVIQHWQEFLPAKETQEERPAVSGFSFRRYEINILVNNGGNSGAPVVYESHPTYVNLFGKVEIGRNGGSPTDFSHIRGGALHRANGGFLILHAAELMSHPFAWKALKRAMRLGYIRLETPYEDSDIFASTYLEPEPVPFQAKVLLVGTNALYQKLQKEDETFRKLFKVKVDFTTTMERTQENIWQYATFLACFCDNKRLRPLTSEAVARLIDYSTREAGHQRKLSVKFHEVTSLLIEADYWAAQEQSAIVEQDHVHAALKETNYRSAQPEAAIHEAIEDGTINIATSGEKIGQINALVVAHTGDYSFGYPTRVTARTYAGSGGIVNIDRESQLTGAFHTKGLHTLTSYLQAEFASDRPLPLAASITFEQSYHLVDGDSASSTELYALLSSLAEVPLRQDIAVTGAVNQFGDVQAIGEVNEKIEGFYYVCKKQGLTKTQGVIIPTQNAKHLMLRNEIRRAVEAGEFHIWAVNTVKEGMEILMSEHAGEVGENGFYASNTVYGNVQQRLMEMAEKHQE